MNEQRGLDLLGTIVPKASDDAAVIDDLVFTIDMLHESTDFPPGTTRYTAGWRSVAASISDVAAMGGVPRAAVAAYGAPTLEEQEIREFVRGAQELCELVEAEYVGGDLDVHQEFTVATAVIGQATTPVLRSGSSPGDLLCVSGTLGRSAAGIRAFEANAERGNELFRFIPRTHLGRQLAGTATAMMDSSDGLIRSLYQMSESSHCGFSVDSAALPIDQALYEFEESERVEQLALTFGEDFELVFTLSESDLSEIKSAVETSVSVIGVAVPHEQGITLDGEPVPNEGYTHGTNSSMDCG